MCYVSKKTLSCQAPDGSERSAGRKGTTTGQNKFKKRKRDTEDQKQLSQIFTMISTQFPFTPTNFCYHSSVLHTGTLITHYHLSLKPSHHTMHAACILMSLPKCLWKTKLQRLSPSYRNNSDLTVGGGGGGFNLPPMSFDVS